MGIDVPLGGGNRGAMHRGAVQARRQGCVVAGEQVAAVQPPGLARVDLVGPVAVVGELVRRQAPPLPAAARFLRYRGVGAQKVEAALQRLPVGVDDAPALGPVRLRVGGVLAHELRPVDAHLAVRHPRVHERGVLQGGDAVAVVVRRALDRELVGGVVGDRQAQVVALHPAVAGAGVRRRQHLAVAGEAAQPQAVMQLAGALGRRGGRLGDGAHEDAAGVRFAVLGLRFPPGAVGAAGQGHQVALIAGVGEGRGMHRHLTAGVAAPGHRRRQRLEGHARQPPPVAPHRGRHQPPQHLHARFPRHQPFDHLARCVGFEVAVGVAARPRQRGVILRRMVAVPVAVVVEQRLPQFIVDGGAAALPLRVPHAQPGREHAAQMRGMGDHRRGQPFARRAHRAGKTGRGAGVDAQINADLPLRRCRHGWMIPGAATSHKIKISTPDGGWSMAATGSVTGWAATCRSGFRGSRRRCSRRRARTMEADG